MHQPQYTWIQVLQDQWWVGVIAFLITLAATPLLRAWGRRRGIMDVPDGALKPHVRPVAPLGGIAMYLGLVAGMVMYVLAMNERGVFWTQLRHGFGRLDLLGLSRNPLWNLGGILLGSTIIVVVGVVDDLRALSPRKKLLGQAGAWAALLLGGVGYRMAWALLPALGLELSPWIMVPVGMLMCLAAVIVACNATNLIDGLDGLCGGVTGIISLGYLVLGVWLATWGMMPGTDDLRTGFSIAMLGAVLGFLPYNLPPASIFMGDSGSMLLGFYVAVMVALFCREGGFPPPAPSGATALLAAVVIFSLPLVDTLAAVRRRLRNGKSILAGDRSHLYDQLVSRGMPVRRVVAIFYGLAAVAAVVGNLVAMFLPIWLALCLYALMAVTAWAVMKWRQLI